MATKNFAIPLNSGSKQTGDITFAEMKDLDLPGTFQLTYITPAPQNQLNLKTSKNSTVTDHVFTATTSSGTASANLSAAQIAAVFEDADGGDWDYVQAQWTVGQTDQGGSSNQFEIIGGKTENGNGWPPTT